MSSTQEKAVDAISDYQRSRKDELDAELGFLKKIQEALLGQQNTAGSFFSSQVQSDLDDVYKP